MAFNLVPQFRRKLQVLTASTAVVVSTLRHDAIDAAACLERRLQSVTPSTRGRHRTHLHHVAGVGVLVVEERPGAGLPRHHTPRVSAMLIQNEGTAHCGCRQNSLERTILVLVDKLQKLVVGADAALSQLSWEHSSQSYGSESRRAPSECKRKTSSDLAAQAEYESSRL